jgi:hypothetical protein
LPLSVSFFFTREGWKPTPGAAVKDGERRKLSFPLSLFVSLLSLGVKMFSVFCLEKETSRKTISRPKEEGRVGC